MLDLTKLKSIFLLAAILMFSSFAVSREHHVSTDGCDTNSGSPTKPFRTISAAADVAQPGDVITVREGVYRERIDPPRGGESDQSRIVYQAAPGEQVVIKGSERVRGWERVQNDTWKVTIANDFFGDFNPYGDLISGDWFDSRGRDHRTGAVYLDGHWLTEAVELADVLEPIREYPIWAYFSAPSRYLLNLAWIQPKGGQAIAAADFTAQRGIETIADSDEKDCIGYIRHRDWVRYEAIDFGQQADTMIIRAASDTPGGIIEIRLGRLDGKVLGTVSIPNTGGWYSWSTFNADITPTSGVHPVYLVFKESETTRMRNEMYDPELDPSTPALWFAEVDDENTTIWAQFAGINPNEADVEINVRQTIFYPSQPGINYITVRGFKMMHAATPWAPPTAEQIGLIGTHWSKGWIIENNDISYSTCVGITLGKHGDQYDNTSANTAEGYVKTIERAKEHGWAKEAIGHHLVRNNRISHCEQAGLVGSLGAIFSTITNNTIHDIHVRRLFCGAETAGIKLHAPIDSLISRNHIYRVSRGIWLDWMTQGTRVTGNLLHDNSAPSPSWHFQDLFIEVNHGPYVIDNNILLSEVSLFDNSQGGAYVHNLFGGQVGSGPEFNRQTPYHEANSTKIAGLSNIEGGDTRFYNNIFVGNGLNSYDNAILPVMMGGNVFLKGAEGSKHEQAPLVLAEFDPEIKLFKGGDGTYVQINFPQSVVAMNNKEVTTELLGKAKIPNLPYKNYDGSYLKINTDYFGVQRDQNNPSAGPFEKITYGENYLRVQ